MFLLHIKGCFAISVAKCQWPTDDKLPLRKLNKTIFNKYHWICVLILLHGRLKKYARHAPQSLGKSALFLHHFTYYPNITP